LKGLNRSVKACTIQTRREWRRIGGSLENDNPNLTGAAREIEYAPPPSDVEPAGLGISESAKERDAFRLDGKVNPRYN
jgi:hypothetical protein